MIHILSLCVIALCVLYKWTRRAGKVIDPSWISCIQQPVPAIDPSFKWDETIPKKIRPFVKKKSFNAEMGIKNIASTPEDWLLLENTYLQAITLRKKFTRLYPDKTSLAYNNEATAMAIREFYETVTTFLLNRYPQYFVVEKDTILNKISGETMPLNGKNTTPHELVLILASHIEEDFLILLKDDPDDHEQEYLLRASITGFPAGFDPSKGHNKAISQIHDLVPQYSSRLKNPMSNFFNKLKPKDLWVRHNWSVQTSANYFNLDSLHGRDGDEIKVMTMDDLDFENGCFLRVERQILTRLPKLRAIFMTVRTYLTPMSEIKKEGSGDELCRGISSLPKEIAFYKRALSWGDAVKEYLQS